MAAARSIRQRRGLPGGRAVVGALLVAAAAVGVFAAYLDAVAGPDMRYLVARAGVEPGTRLVDAAAVADLFELRPLDLDDAVAANAFAEGRVDRLIGRVVVAPLAAGDLLLESATVDDGGVAGADSLSFPVDASAALAGGLRAGERIDVLATYGSGESAWTTYVVRGLPLVAVGGSDGAGLGGGTLTLTVAVADPVEVQALVHAVHTADVVVTRATGSVSDRDPAPGPYRPDRDAPGLPADGVADPDDGDIDGDRPAGQQEPGS